MSHQDHLIAPGSTEPLLPPGSLDAQSFSTPSRHSDNSSVPLIQPSQGCSEAGADSVHASEGKNRGDITPGPSADRNSKVASNDALLVERLEELIQLQRQALAPKKPDILISIHEFLLNCIALLVAAVFGAFTILAWKLAQSANTLSTNANAKAEEANSLASRSNSLAQDANSMSERGIDLASVANSLSDRGIELASNANLLSQQGIDLASEANFMSGAALNLAKGADSDAKQANCLTSQGNLMSLYSACRNSTEQSQSACDLINSYPFLESYDSESLPDETLFERIVSRAIEDVFSCLAPSPSPSPTAQPTSQSSMPHSPTHSSRPPEGTPTGTSNSTPTSTSTSAGPSSTGSGPGSGGGSDSGIPDSDLIGLVVGFIAGSILLIVCLGFLRYRMHTSQRKRVSSSEKKELREPGL